MKFLKKLFVNDNNKNLDNNSKIVNIYSPLFGEIMNLEDMPDEAFASKSIGDGIAIIPAEDSNCIFAPCNSDEVSVFETNHAISFETAEGLELLIHFGVDTVELNGKGFERLIEAESKVKTGDELIRYNLQYIKERVKSHKTPVLIANMEEIESIEKMTGQVKPGDLIMKIKMK